MPGPPADRLADQLLDLQVEFVVAELTGERLTALVTGAVDDFFEWAATRRLDEVVDGEALKLSGRWLIDVLSTSPLVGEVAVALAAGIYDQPAGGERRLGEVVDRGTVAALVDAVLALGRLHDRAMDRMADSPMVGLVANRFLTVLVGDLLQPNRQLAQRVPGMSSLFSLGLGAAAKVRSATVDPFLGDGAGRGGQFAVRRTNEAVRELLHDPHLARAAMELWDMHAGEPVTGLRAYLSAAEVSELVTLVVEIVASAGTTQFAADTLDACVDAVLDEFGGTDVATLVDELGVAREDLVDLLVRHGTTLIEGARDRGELDGLIRPRLAPFFASPEVRALLDRAGRPARRR